MKQFFKFHHGITAVLLINIIFYVLIIYKVPWFFSDDFYIFYRVGENLKYGLYPNTNEFYHLFFRPFLYLTFILDYKFLISNPSLIKITTLFIHLGFLISLYFLFISFCKIYGIKIYKNFISGLILALSLSPVSCSYILWISSKNVALLNLFFVLALFFVSRFILRNKPVNLFFSFLFFVLAALSKQQAFIFPAVLLILIFSVKKQLTKDSGKQLYILFAITAAFSVLLILVNMLNISTGDFGYFRYFYYKKPFVFFGTLYLTLIPLYYNEVYNFFSSNLFVTAAIAAAITLIVVTFAIRKRDYRKSLMLIILLWLISFFPQIMVHNEIRNLNMQLLVLYFILLILLPRLRYKNIILIITLLLIIINAFVTVRTADNSVVHQTLNVNEFSVLNKIIGNNPDSNYVVLLSYHSGFNLPYEYYYYQNNIFGKSGIRGLPLYWRLENNPEYYLKNPHSFAGISLNKDTLTVNSTNDNISIFGDIFSLNVTEVQLNKFKGFKKIKMILPGEFQNKTKLFFDGKDWLIVQ